MYLCIVLWLLPGIFGVPWTAAAVFEALSLPPVRFFEPRPAVITRASNFMSVSLLSPKQYIIYIYNTYIYYIYVSSLFVSSIIYLFQESSWALLTVGLYCLEQRRSSV